jgi:hypothetical protein
MTSRMKTGLTGGAATVAAVAAVMAVITASTALHRQPASVPTVLTAADHVVLQPSGAASAGLTAGMTTAAQAAAGDLQPGHAVQSCLAVTYVGVVPARVRLYMESESPPRSDGLNFASYVHLAVEEGVGQAVSCAGFTPHATIWGASRHPNAPSDLLSQFPASPAHAVASALPSWHEGTMRTYRFTLTFDRVTPNGTQGASGQSPVIVWQAGTSPTSLSGS